MKIAILWDGQLWALTAITAQNLWYEVKVFWAVWKNAPAAQVAPYTQIDYTEKTISKIINYKPDVVTSEWENIPVNLLEKLEENGITVAPNSKIMKIVQDRRNEKQAVIKAWEKVVNYMEVDSLEDLEQAFKKFWIWILKTAKDGYDGKWQYKISNLDDIKNFNIHFDIPYIYEQNENFDYEISVMVARNKKDILVYEPNYNIHKNWILIKSVLPAKASIDIDNKILEDAKKIAQNIANYLDIVWLLCVEMFVHKNGDIKVNELAPRPHNSYHHSIESYNISQYEALIKALSWEKFWELQLKRPSTLTNLLWNDIKNIPNRKQDMWFSITNDESIVYYDYGKWKGLSNDIDYPSKRKMGHKVKF